MKIKETNGEICLNGPQKERRIETESLRYNFDTKAIGINFSE
jgi:hypothetical protein